MTEPVLKCNLPFYQTLIIYPLSRRNQNNPIQAECQTQVQDPRIVTTLDTDMFLWGPEI